MSIDTMKVDGLTSDYGRWLIHGPQGTGKTSLAATIAEAGPTLFIDLTGEKGIRSIQGTPYSDNIDVTRPGSVTALDDIFWELNKGGHGYVAVVIDSLTALQKMTMRYLLGHDETAVREIKQGTSPADIRTWGQALDVMTDTATFWYGLADGNRKEPMHVVMTAQTKVSDDEVSGDRLRTPDVQRGALSITLAAPDYIVYCVDEQTEALTARGWKRYDELAVGEPVYTLDHETGQARWEPLTRVNVFSDQPSYRMLSIEGQGHSSLTTLNHRWPTLYRSTDAREPEWKRRWRTSETLNQNDHLLVAASPDSGLLTEPKFSDSFVELLAWATTEGHVNRSRMLTLGQSPTANPLLCDRINAALVALIGPEADEMRTLRYTGKPAWKRDEHGSAGKSMSYWRLNQAASAPLLEWLSDDKTVVLEFYRLLTHSQLELFIRTALAADGWISTNPKSPYEHNRFAQKSRSRAESFQIACIMAGYATSFRQQSSGMWEVGILSRSMITPSRNVVKQVDHEGMVWCPTTPSGTWLARRNGTTYWTGNTDVEDNMDHLADDSLPAVTHLVRFGANPEYRTKARLPYNLRGKIPSVLGRKQPTSLISLSRVLGVGGIPEKDAAATKSAKGAKGDDK